MRKKCFIIAELSANHNGDIEIAKESIMAAKNAGADAVKIQTYTADTITLDCKSDDFQVKGGTIWDGKYLYNLYQEGSLPWEWHKELFDLAKDLDLVCFSSPFDFSAVDFLETLNCPIYKIASFEITDIPLIEYVARKQKPVIISTGVATYDDIKLAIETCKNVGNNDITILKCTSSYPAPIDEVNLALMKKFAHDFDVKIGLSDHTIGNLVPILSIAYGATMIEKHFKLNDQVGGPDASFSLNQEEFKKMVNDIRKAEKAIGEIDYCLTEKQKKGKDYSRSLYIIKNVKKGDVLSSENIRSIRPGFGMHPKHYKKVLGKHFVNDYEKGTRLSFKHIK
tara:strand:+ start:8266 stop:9279 length:1014 start_codon:yes stop_codon:yes gene_type:complete